MTNPILLYTIELFLLMLIIVALWNKADTIFVKGLVICTTIIPLSLCFGLWQKFDKTKTGYQFCCKLHVIPDYNIDLSVGLDGLSLCLFTLTSFIFFLCALASVKISYPKYKTFLLYLLLTELLLLLSWIVKDLLFFFVFFESSLIPVFLMIGAWGSRPRKVKAAFYFFLYTFTGSMFLLVGIIYIYLKCGTTSYYVILNTSFTDSEQLWLFWCFFIPFAVKIPMFPFHIWLPEAHVEAPTIGSVILASIMLKLGGYGFLRFTLTMFPFACQQYNFVISTLAIIGIIYASWSTMIQNDVKRIIAYSSIAHMNLGVLGLFSNTAAGINGAFYLMLGHGIVSAGLFFCVGILYERHKTRLLDYFGGLTLVMPVFANLFLWFTLGNMGFPGTSNFTGELLILVGLFQKNVFLTFIAATGITWSAIYSIWMYNRLMFGALKTTSISEFTDIEFGEYCILVILVLAMLLLGIFPEVIILTIDPCVENILAASANI